MRLIETKTLDTASALIEFTDIPQNFTDLVLMASARGGRAATINGIIINFNSTGSGVTVRGLYGNGSSVASNTDAVVSGGAATGSSNTANIFGSSQIYISNYTGSTNKSFSVDSVNENNASEAWLWMNAGLWSNTDAITSIQLTSQEATNFQIGTTVSLYGIGGLGNNGPKAIGGMVTKSGDYWVHTFTASGTFTPLTNLTNVEYLVIAGGGGGGTTGSNYANGGGGAGGYRSSVVGENSGGGATAESRISLNSGTNYTITVGSGGTAAASGTDSSISSLIVSTGGGRGGSGLLGAAPANGGSGGGSGSDGSNSSTPGTGVAGQGFAGSLGSGTTGHTSAGGGGGGAGAAGIRGTINPNAATTTAGIGGAGVSSSITGSAVTRGGGGGGGQDNANNFGAGGTGGGGAGGGSSTAATNGTANTGGGGGGRNVGNASANGGSGIVIVRYAA